ncbi:MAG: N-acetylglucosamine-6-phosphate deacetylase [Erysipelotrichaceae bacterium]|nr:N-acetylglucosamine-6-phosphate deacetylase [Erysipelotrichaceae bacterium]
MSTLIKNCIIVPDGKTKFKGSVLVEEGKIKSFYHDGTELPESDGVVEGDGNYLLPGMIDIHLHGSYGYDFIRDPQNSINEVAKGLVKEGTTAFMASLTVVSHDELCGLLNEYRTVQQPEHASLFLGVHSEGPYLSKEYKALMDDTWLRDPDLKELDDMLKSAGDCLKIMTIAPERKGMDAFIPEAIKQNITLMIGHTATTCEEAENALNQGVTGFTHLYNAMTQHQHRAPGAVTAALLHPEAFCELIVDGFHTHPDTVRATWKMMGPEQIVLITDAMLGKGMPDGEYEFSLLKCRKTGSTVQVIETGRIAGSCITMIDAIQHMKEYTNCSINDIVQMACINPAKVAKVFHKKGSLEIGKDADLILLDENLRLKYTMVNGESLYFD